MSTTNDNSSEKIIERHNEASQEVLKMTRAEAIAYMGLPANANAFAIDEKFWQLSKRYKSDSEEDKQKLTDLSAAYDIATGRRDNRAKAIEIRNTQKKYFGKTSDEWANHFTYNWYIYVLAVILIIAGSNLIYNMFIKPKIDCGIVSIGHFDIENDDVYYQLLKDDMGFKNPYITYVNVVVPNEEGATGNAYQSQNATTAFMSRPNIVVTDSMTAPYYFEYFIDMSEFYEQLTMELTDSQLRRITPVYCTEQKFYQLSDAYAAEIFINPDVNEDYSQYSTEPVMIGLMIDDEDTITSMGYSVLWKDVKPNLVFGIYYDTMSYEDSKQILINLFKSI